MNAPETRAEVLDIIEQLQEHAWMLGELQMQIAELPDAAEVVAAMQDTIRRLEIVAELMQARN